MLAQQLVVNGCSYMQAYVDGNGHRDLADRLNIPAAESLAISGSANARILRTTVKHSFATDMPTFYVLGMTFVSRDELPIVLQGDSFEGAWTNPQNQDFETRWVPHWNRRDTEKYVELKLKWEMYSIPDRYEDLLYRMLAVSDSLRSREHDVIFFNQADDLFSSCHDDPRLAMYQNHANIVGDYRWQSIPWQHSQGVPAMQYAESKHSVPDHIKHRESGQHSALNQYLADHIHSNRLIS